MNMVTYNIVSGGNSRVAIALKTMESMNVDLGVSTETKLVKDLHTLGGYGYTVCATESKTTHQGGVALFYKKAEDWHIEGVKTFGPNPLGATLVSGSWRRSIIGAYIPPSEEEGKTLEFIEAAAKPNHITGRFECRPTRRESEKISEAGRHSTRCEMAIQV